MLRSSLEAVVKSVYVTREKKFAFAGHVWSSKLVKPFINSFQGQEVEVTLEPKGNPELPALFFKWRNGSAWIHPYMGAEATLES